MAAEFDEAFAALKKVSAKHSAKLAVKTDTAKEYSLEGRVPSPFP